MSGLEGALNFLPEVTHREVALISYVVSTELKLKFQPTFLKKSTCF